MVRVIPCTFVLPRVRLVRIPVLFWNIDELECRDDDEGWHLSLLVFG
jgi:hypothetical protein